MRKDILTFGSPAVGEDEIQEVADTIRSGWIGTGPKTADFENIFKSYIGADHALAVNSCTAALHLSMLAAGIGPGDEVITTPLTFCATANAIMHTGATPVFVDVDRHTMNIDPAKIEQAIGPFTRAILPVHLGGRPCDMDPIMEFAKRKNLLVIEDAAHCIEGIYRGQKVGNIGDAGCFSFYVTKNIVTAEGGMITTRHNEWAAKLKSLALHGLSHDAWDRYKDKGYQHYSVLFPGFKYNMTDIQASFGLQQMKKIEAFYKRREEIWRKYDEAFKDLPLVVPAGTAPDVKHARHLYSVLIDIENTGLSRDEFQARLYEKKIGTGVHYLSLHLHQYYRETFGFRPEDFPEALYISDRTVSLPLSAKLTDEDVDDVIEAVQSVLS